MTCVICDHRPAVKGGSYCNNCKAKIEADKRHRNGGKPFRYATYQGHVIAFFRNGGGKLVYRLIKRKPENLPKGITLDLNRYIHGFDRVQVKKIKTAILQLANA